MVNVDGVKRSLRMNVKAVLARAYVRVVGVNRDLSWVAFGVILPLLSVAAYIFVYLSDPNIDSSHPLIIRVIIGGAMTAF